MPRFVLCGVSPAGVAATQSKPLAAPHSRRLLRGVGLMRRERGLRAGALSLSLPDLLWREGSYFEEPLFPAQLGYDAAGVVEALGPEVTTLKVG